MMDNLALVQAKRYLDHLQRIMEDGDTLSPRGSEIREIRDQQLLVDVAYPFMTFEQRKYDVGYFKQEMLWKLTANPYNESIKNHAKMWESIQNPDRTFNSNYGQYWFGTQGGIWSVVTELIRDPDSRRAVIPMLSKDHMRPETIDTVCTESVGFHIRNGILHMSVHMRSSDAVFGLGTDIPTFACLYRLVYGLIRPIIDVFPGTMTITAMSSHIYSRHYAMVDRILEDGLDGFVVTTMPFCGSDEAMYIIAKRGSFPALWPREFDLVGFLVGKVKNE